MIYSNFMIKMERVEQGIYPVLSPFLLTTLKITKEFNKLTGVSSKKLKIIFTESSSF